MFPILNKSSTIDINLALIIYKSLTRSILTYASPVWGYAAKTHTNKLQTFQNKVLRIITKLPRVTPILTLHEQTGMPLISHIRKLARAVYQKSANSDNSQIKGLGHYDLTGDKHPASLISPCKLNYFVRPPLVTTPLEQTLKGQKVCLQVSTGSHNPEKFQSCEGHTDA
jgi:hypothetical protein